MTTKQINKLTMNKTVNVFFEDEKDKLTANIPLQYKIVLYSAETALLEKHGDAQATNTKGKTAVKNHLHDTMIAQTIAYASPAAAYFADLNSPLESQLAVSKSELTKMAGAEVKILCNKIYEILRDHSAVLSPDYVTLAEINQLSNSVAQFDAKAYDAFLSKDNTQNASKLIQIAFKNITISLKSIDRLMKKYELTDNELYNKYRLARKIPNLGTRHKIDPK
jgi:hypothetical protein